MFVPIWLMILSIIIFALALYAIASSLDQGHRCFVVTSTKVIQVLAPILQKHAGLTEIVTCRTPPVDQTMMTSGLVFMTPPQGRMVANVEPATTLALIQKSFPHDYQLSVDDLLTRMSYIPNACSVLSSDPLAAVQETREALLLAGFSAHILVGFMRGQEDEITLIASDAFIGWILVFRRHLIRMTPPGSPHLVTREERLLCLAKVIRTDIRIRAWFKELRGTK
jgi:hypothetical protein